MDGKKETIVVFISVLISSFSFAQTKNEKDLIVAFMKQKFSVFNKSKFVDSSYIRYKQRSDADFCIANPGEKFNETDLREEGFCDMRLVKYGYSQGRKLQILLYEEDHGGGKGKTCDIYYIQNNEVSQLVSFYVPPTVNSISSLKRAIKSNLYTIVAKHPE